MKWDFYDFQKQVLKFHVCVERLNCGQVHISIEWYYASVISVLKLVT